MKIFELLARDPRKKALVNSGQARITSLDDQRHLDELRDELETFVCDGHYGDAIVRILTSYLKNLDRPKQDAAWVSGFFGSGKSHLLKMLGHLWVNTAFEDGSTARSLVPNLPQEVKDLLRELDTQIARSKRDPVAASGTLPAGSGDFVKMTVLSVILQAQRLPEQYAQARFCFWLKEQGHYDAVRQSVEDAGKEWLKELNNLYVSGVIAKAVLACDANFAADEREARKTIRETFPNKSDDITTDEFLEMARLALEVDGELPLTILILDEVQQYIGDSTDRAVAVTEITEAIYTQLDSRVMLVASGQASLSATPQLQKLKDRYRINAPLSDTDVEAVTRKVLLRKNAAALPDIEAMLQSNAGEIAKQLDGTRLCSCPEDQVTIALDYPLLPTRRRFWELCFRAVDAEGTHSQLRSQLRILHDTLVEAADDELGAVIPADALFDALSANLVQTGVLLNEIDLRIRKLDDSTEGGILRKRICGLVFLISKLPRDEGVDAGVRATAKMISDLMVGNITVDSGPFRNQVATALEELAGDSTLMKIGDVYRLQTTEGAEWDAAFRQRVASIRNNATEIEHKRSQLLGAAIQIAVDKVSLRHGDSKAKRSLSLHAGAADPVTDGDGIVIWLRDGWTVAQKEVESDARTRGHDDHVVHLFLPRKAADDLTLQIAELEAARQTIDTRGIPTTNEGREARESMASRRTAAQASIDSLVGEIIGAAKVFQGGGSEVFGNVLTEKLQTAAEASMARLFPEFGVGDHKGWGAALKRARDGSDEPLRTVDWDKSIDDHPVVRRVLSEIGNGAKGVEIRKTLQSSPFGWPRDAIDTALIALHRAGVIRANLNGQSVPPGHLDQNKISTTSFEPERVRLTTNDKVQLRALFQGAGVQVVKAGEEEAQARKFITVMRTLASEAGGDAPLPPCPDLGLITDLSTKQGSEQLGAIHEARETLADNCAQWTQTRDLIGQRQPAWAQLCKLIQYTRTLDVHDQIASEMKAIESNSSLLATADLVSPLLATAGSALRAAITAQDKAYAGAFTSGKAVLDSDAAWNQLDDGARTTTLQQVGLVAPETTPIAGDQELITALTHADLDARASSVAAVHERVKRALEESARTLKPDAKRIALRAATLESESEVKAWVTEHETKLLDAVAKAPVIVG